MTISLTALSNVSGVPVTPSNGYVTGQPWNTSPSYPAAVEQASPISLSRIDSETVELTWDADSGEAPRATVKIRLQLRGNTSVSHFVIDWGDGTPAEVVSALGLFNLTLQLEHVYTVGSTSIQVDAYDASNVLVDAASLAVSITLSSVWAVDQYRIEKYKGAVNYHEPGKRWLQDWAEYTGVAAQLSFNDYNAVDSWSWGYRLWLRSVDDQGRPDLVILSPWATI